MRLAVFDNEPLKLVAFPPYLGLALGVHRWSMLPVEIELGPDIADIGEIARDGVDGASVQNQWFERGVLHAPDYIRPDGFCN